MTADFAKISKNINKSLIELSVYLRGIDVVDLDPSLMFYPLCIRCVCVDFRIRGASIRVSDISERSLRMLSMKILNISTHKKY